MYDFIEIATLTKFIYSLFAALFAAFGTIKAITVALDLLKSLD